MASVTCACTTTPTSMCPCWPACSIGAAGATRRSATGFCFRRVRFQDGRPTSSCRQTPCGSATTPAACSRLVRDGVDVPLAKPVRARDAQVPPDAEGADGPAAPRRRSSFGDSRRWPRRGAGSSLNGRLPIPFGQQGRLEVDLLCADARMAVELDGRHHLADPRRTDETAGRTNCCRRTATSCCGSWRRTLRRIWTPCSTSYCARWLIDVDERVELPRFVGHLSVATERHLGVRDLDAHLASQTPAKFFNSRYLEDCNRNKPWPPRRSNTCSTGTTLAAASPALQVLDFK